MFKFERVNNPENLDRVKVDQNLGGYQQYSQYSSEGWRMRADICHITADYMDLAEQGVPVTLDGLRERIEAAGFTTDDFDEVLQESYLLNKLISPLLSAEAEEV